MLKNFAQNVFKWHYFDQVYSRFTRDGKMAFFTSQTRPLRRETSQRRQPEVFLEVISLPLAVTDVCRRQILSRLLGSQQRRRQRQREHQKSNLGLFSKTTNLHLHHSSSAVTERLRRENAKFHVLWRK